MKSYCEVAVNTPFNNSILTYQSGEGIKDLKRGDFVMVPLGKRQTHGCLLKTSMSETELDGSLNLEKIKTINEAYDCQLHLPEEELALLKWVADYYHYSLGQHIFDCLPKVLKKPRPLKFETGKGRELAFQLNPQQQGIVDQIEEKRSQGFSKWLIHGVTGSGKTAVYLKLIQKTLSEGKSVLFLLPEINLTPQFIKTFVEHISAPIYSYNSGISNSDRYGLWKLLLEDDGPKVIIGVRSSIFLPVQSLGLIVVDEEHDSSFKQEDRCPYNARDVAIKKASLKKIPVVLGSATPTMETYQNFKEKNQYFEMRERIGTSILPKIELIDLREKEEGREEYYPFTKKSLEAIREAFDKDEQVLVFINRLGFANFIQCRGCGHQFDCPNCSQTLKYFRSKGSLSCQYCEYVVPLPEICPDCSNMSLLQKGYGTEKLQEVLNRHFPDKRIERFDRDEIKTMKALEERLGEFHAGKIDLLVGTQMLSKGHNFKKVNTVLILGVDGQLNFPDFRSHERVYQLLTQVSGRSGRFGEESRVLIHTLNPDSKIFTYPKNADFEGFYNDEMPLREACVCPPFSKLAMIYLTSKFQNRAIETGNSLATAFQKLKESHFDKIEVLGPRPATIEKKVNKYTWSVMVRSTDVNQLHNAIHTIKENFSFHHSLSVKYDLDPYHIH